MNTINVINGGIVLYDHLKNETYVYELGDLVFKIVDNAIYVYSETDGHLRSQVFICPIPCVINGVDITNINEAIYAVSMLTKAYAETNAIAGVRNQMQMFLPQMRDLLQDIAAWGMSLDASLAIVDSKLALVTTYLDQIANNTTN